MERKFFGIPLKNILISVKPEDESNSLVTSIRGITMYSNGFNRVDIKHHIFPNSNLLSEEEAFLLDSAFYIRVLSSKSISAISATESLKPYLIYKGKTIRVINIELDRFFRSALLIQNPKFTFEGSWIQLFDRSNIKLRQFFKIISTSSVDSILQFDLIIPISEPGSIIQLNDRINQRIFEDLIRNPKEIKTMNRRVFEQFIAELFWNFGYEVELTQQTRDGGKDIIAIKNNEVKIKYLIECKRPNIGNPIGVKTIRELYGVKSHEKATKAIIATSTYFSPQAIEMVEEHCWELEAKDYEGILDWIEKYKEGR